MADITDEAACANIIMTCKHVLPQMIAQRSGCIINVSSTASLAARPTVTYKTSKAGVNALTQHIAIENAAHGIRAHGLYGQRVGRCQRGAVFGLG